MLTDGIRIMEFLYTRARAHEKNFRETSFQIYVYLTYFKVCFSFVGVSFYLLNYS